MEAEITSKLKDIIETEDNYDIPSELLFHGDDHYDWRIKKVDLFFSTFEHSIKK